MSIRPWKILHSHCLVRDRWMILRTDRCELPSGVVVEPYYVQQPPDWVQVIAFDAKDRILITRQHRHGAGLVSTELPCGVVEPGETAAQAAARELLEETGNQAETLVPLPVLSPNPARYSNRIHAFIGMGTQQVQDQRMDETEEIEFEFLPVDEVLALIDTGLFSQALHVATILLALRKLGILIQNR